MKELDRTTKASAQINADWLKGGEGPVCWVQCANMWQDCSLAAVQRNTAFVEQSWIMIAWNWHVRINAIVFVPTAKAPPKAGAKELSYNNLNLAYSGQHLCFGPNWFFQFCHLWREYAVPWKALPRKQANVDTRHQILPGLAQGSFQIEKLDRTTSYCSN